MQIRKGRNRSQTGLGLKIKLLFSKKTGGRGEGLLG
jgi:hypothetical protein